VHENTKASLASLEPDLAAPVSARSLSRQNIAVVAGPRTTRCGSSCFGDRLTIHPTGPARTTLSARATHSPVDINPPQTVHLPPATTRRGRDSEVDGKHQTVEVLTAPQYGVDVGARYSSKLASASSTMKRPVRLALLLRRVEEAPFVAAPARCSVTAAVDDEAPGIASAAFEVPSAGNRLATAATHLPRSTGRVVVDGRQHHDHRRVGTL
jgi:hypothetical protein